MLRQFVSLSVMVTVTAVILYLITASLSYAFVFDRNLLSHPLILEVSEYYLWPHIYWNVKFNVCYTVAGLRGREGRPPPRGRTSLNFMQFLGKFGKIVCWLPLLGEILDPPLLYIYWYECFFVNQWWIQDFSDGGRVLTSEFGVKNIIWQDFCQKLHENERNWTERRRASLAPPWIHQC